MQTGPLDNSKPLTLFDALPLAPPASRDGAREATFAKLLSGPPPAAPASAATPRATEDRPPSNQETRERSSERSKRAAAPQPDAAPKPNQQAEASAAPTSEDRGRAGESGSSTGDGETEDSSRETTPETDAPPMAAAQAKDMPAARTDDELEVSELAIGLATASEVVEKTVELPPTDEAGAAVSVEETPSLEPGKSVPAPLEQSPAPNKPADLSLEVPQADSASDIRPAQDVHVEALPQAGAAESPVMSAMHASPVNANATIEEQAVAPTVVAPTPASEPKVSQEAESSPDVTPLSDEIKSSDVAKVVPPAEQLPEGNKRESKRERRQDRVNAERGRETLAPSVHEPVDAAVAKVPSLENVSSVATSPVAESLGATPEAKVEAVASTVTPTSVPATDGGASLTSKLPPQLAAKGGSQGASGPPVTQAEQMRLVQRVARAVQAAQARGGEIQIRLSPPSLGSLKLEVKVQNGVMAARIEAENATSRTILLENLPVLKERLAEQGIQVESFDVDLMDRQPQGQPDTSHGRERQPDPRLPRGVGRRRVDEVANNTPTKSPASEASLRPGDGKINVTI